MRYSIGRSHLAGRRLKAVIRATFVALALVAAPGTELQAQFGIPGLGGLVGGLLSKGPQVVVDPTAIAKLVTQLDQQIQQIQVARSQLQVNVDNMRKLANPPWRRINATMAQVDQLAQQGQALAYTLRNVDAQFRQTFPVGESRQPCPPICAPRASAPSPPCSARSTP